MQAVILVAGRGTRMQPLTYEIPKPLLPVAGKPIVAYSVEALPAVVTDVIFVVGYLEDQVRAAFGAEYAGRRIHYVRQDELLGSGHALSLCRPLLQGRFFALAGDDVYDPADFVRALGYDRCLFAKEVVASEQRNYGLFTIDADDHLQSIVETELGTGERGLVFTGLSLLDEHFFEYPLAPIRGGTEFGLPQTVVRVAKDYPVKILTTESWLPVGYPEDLPKAEKHLRQQGRII